MTTRIDSKFIELAKQNRPALVCFVTAGDPDFETSKQIVAGLPEAGADIIEFGMPFSDPMAEGPPVQASSKRALQAGMTMVKTLELVRHFRKSDDTTPIVLMGYYNPIYSYGPDKFLDDAKAAGVDGFIVVDLPSEADAELCVPALNKGLNFIRLATPTTDDKRLPAVLKNTSGFVYYVSMTGITGAGLGDTVEIGNAVARIKTHTDLPVAVGFGIKTAEHAKTIGRDADGVVIGSILVEAVRTSLDAKGKATDKTVSAVLDVVRDIAKGARAARG